MIAYLFVAGVIVVIFACDIGWRWWSHNAWKRHWRDDDSRHPEHY